MRPLTIEVGHVRHVHGDGNLRAFVDVTIENAFAIHGIRVVEGSKGLFVAMPSEKGRDGEYREIVHPVTKEAREELNRVVLAAVENGGK